MTKDSSADDGYANDTDIPATWTDHLPHEDFIDRIDYDNEIERIRILLDRSHSYMRNAHLLPPPGEFGSADEYVRVLERFEQAPATQVSFYRFNPTTAQRRANAAVLSRWHADQHKRKRKPSETRINARLNGWLDNAFRGVINDIATRPKGDWNSRLYWAARRLAELGLDETDCKQALMDASAHWDTNQTWRDRSRATMNNGWRDGIAHPIDLNTIELDDDDDGH